MANRTEPLFLEEATARKLIWSDEDAEQFEEVRKLVRSHDTIKYENNIISLDEGRRDKKRDLSWNGKVIDEIDGHYLGPLALGGNALTHLLIQGPIGYVKSEHPRMSEVRLRRELAKWGYEKYAEKYGADLKSRTRVVKKLLEKKREDGIPAQRFIREIGISEGYDHPHFPHAIYSDREDYTFVSRMFWGTQLNCLGNTRNLREKFHLGVHMVKNLMEFCQAGILHRDINGNNILDRDDLKTDFIDFGLSSFRKVNELTSEQIAEQQGITQALFVEGTLATAAPEVLLYTLKKHTVESDIFAAAATFYNLMTGRNYLELSAEERKEAEDAGMGLEAKTISKLFQWSKGGNDFRVIPMRELNPSIPDIGLDELLVEQCMAVDPKDRPSKFSSVYKKLRKMEKSLDSRAMRAKTAHFQLPSLIERTAMFEQAEINETERRKAEDEKAQEKKRQTMGFERRSVSTAEYNAQGIQVLGDSEDLQAAIDEIDVFGDENDILAAADHLVTGDPNDTTRISEFVRRNSGRLEAVPENESRSEPTIVIPSDQQPDYLDKTIIIPSNQLGYAKHLMHLRESEGQSIPYTPRKLRSKPKPHKKFSRKK